MDWINCNVCCRQPCDEKERLFTITNCGHILCDLCLSKAESRSKCRVCSQQCQLMELSSNMKPEAGMYFQDPIDVLKKHYLQFKRLLEFQRGHRTILVSFHRKVVSKYKELEREYKLTLEKNHHLQKEYKLTIEKVQQLEKEIIKLRELLSSSAGSNGRRELISSGGSGHPQDAYQRVLSASSLRISPQESNHHVSPHNRAVPGRLTLLKGKVGSPAYRISPNRVSSNLPMEGFKMVERISPQPNVRGNTYGSAQVTSTNDFGPSVFSTPETSKNSSPFLRNMVSDSPYFMKNENHFSQHRSSVQSKRMQQPLNSVENFSYKPFTSTLYDGYSPKKF